MEPLRLIGHEPDINFKKIKTKIIIQEKRVYPFAYN